MSPPPAHATEHRTAGLWLNPGSFECQVDNLLLRVPFKTVYESSQTPRGYSKIFCVDIWAWFWKPFCAAKSHEKESHEVICIRASANDCALAEQPEHIHLVGVDKVVNMWYHSCHLSSEIPVKLSIPSTTDNIYWVVCAWACVMCERLSVMLNCFLGPLPSAMARSSCLSAHFILYTWWFSSTLFRYIWKGVNI